MSNDDDDDEQPSLPSPFFLLFLLKPVLSTLKTSPH